MAGSIFPFTKRFEVPIARCPKPGCLYRGIAEEMDEVRRRLEEEPKGWRFLSCLRFSKVFGFFGLGRVGLGLFGWFGLGWVVGLVWFGWFGLVGLVWLVWVGLVGVVWLVWVRLGWVCFVCVGWLVGGWVGGWVGWLVGWLVGCSPFFDPQCQRPFFTPICSLGHTT